MLYALRRTPEGYCIIKSDDDFNYQGSYLIMRQASGLVCTCPSRATCRHIKMIEAFEKRKRVDTTWFLDFERQKWTKVKV